MDRIKKHSTNYYNTFIEVAEDCPINKAEIPPIKGDKRTVANYQFDLINRNSYKYTSDDILFKVYAIRKDILVEDLEAERQNFFSKGQPCFRASPLTKRYGWGIHSDKNEKIAMLGVETEEYQKFVNDKNIKKVKGMRNKRK